MFTDEAKLIGSHHPLLTAVLGALKPQSAVECGCGHYSTPLLASKVAKLLTVEHSPEWAAKFTTLSALGEHRWRVEPLEISADIPPAKLAGGDFFTLQRIYRGISKEIEPFNLLFVDGFAASRVFALASLGEIADYVVMHDTEPQWQSYYQWSDALPLIEKRYLYQLRPDATVNGRPVPWTDLWVNAELNIAELQAITDPLSVQMFGAPAPLLKVI